MMRWVLWTVACCSLAFTFNELDHRKQYPQDDFVSPVDQQIFLSGTFGELRPNHFHAGIDIKAKDGKVGQPIYSIADGYIYRIKVQSGGYGNVLYLRHPNGYTSTYAHLQKFSPEVAAYVKAAQYRKKSFAIELFPTASEFPVRKGQPIGKLGVSGRSFGPHLHFEIRDAATEKPINPLLFGFKVRDTRRPRLHEVKVYELNDKRETLATKKYNLKQGDTNYWISRDTLLFNAWRVGFGLKAYDHMNGVGNWNGVYSMDLLQDGKLVYNFEMETFSFDESRFINSHLDYEEQITKKSYFNRLYTLPGNKLSIYQGRENNGVVNLSKDKASLIEMIVKDLAGNISKVKFWAKRKADIAPPASAATFNYILPYNEENIIRNNVFEAHFPKGSFYQNLYLQYRSSAERSNGYYSSVHHLHNFKTPVHRYFTIRIKPSFLPDELRSKAFVAYCDTKTNKISNYGGKWKDGMLEARVRDLGDYCIMVDTETPTITPVDFSSNMKGYNRMSFKITDNMETGARAKDLRFKALVDGQWILMTYDAKKDIITHRFDERIGPGQHQLYLEVTDDRGNVTTLERSFVR
ncbi:MAG: M23 family metallopeptidase [Bacteroidota bacterium]